MLHSHLIIVYKKYARSSVQFSATVFRQTKRSKPGNVCHQSGGTIHKMMQKISNPFFKEWYGYIHERNVDYERRVEKLSVKCDIYSCFALFLRLFWSRSSLDVKWADIFKDEPNFLGWGWLDVLVVFSQQ